MDVRREGSTERVGIAVGEVNLVGTTVYRERDLRAAPVFQDGSVEVVDELRHVPSSHVTIIPRTPTLDGKLER